MIDVLYRVRPGNNESLRYSLRSLANVPHGDVYIVGHPPKWVKNVHVIQPRMWRTKWRALTGDLALACRELTGRRLLLVDDDMYILRKHKRVTPVHGGGLREAAARKLGTYGRTLAWTADYLEALGIAAPLSYEIHVPFEMDANAMLSAIAPVVDAPRPLQARTVYGNVVGIGGAETQDVKLKDGPLPADYLSTAPHTWRYWQPQLERLFPEPSEHE